MADSDIKLTFKAMSEAVKAAQKMAQKRKPVTNDDDADAGGDPKNGSKIDKAIQTVDPRQFVKINPPLDKISESTRSQSKIDYLIRNGLGDQDHLTYYRQAMADPKKAMGNPNLRKYVAEVLEEMLDLVFNDAQTYNRVRTLLQKNGKHLKEVEKDPLESPGGVGTDEVTKKYADMTPGQSFALIKKALKGTKNDR